MTITPINPIGDAAKALRPIPVPMPVAQEFVPLPGPMPTGTGGIVPPWLEGIDFGDEPGWGLELYDPKNPIAPEDPNTPVIMERNPGIVPPWLK